jgi:hypothetical protein
MNSASCPFSIFPKKFPKKDELNSVRRKERFVTIDIALDHSNPSSQKITHKCHKLSSIEVEEVHEFCSTFVVKTLALPRGPQQLRLIPAMMGHGAPKRLERLHSAILASVYGRRHFF